MIRIDKNGFDNSLRRYKSLIKTYKKPWPRYQRYAQILFKNNFFCFITLPTENQKSFEKWLMKHYTMQNFALK